LLKSRGFHGTNDLRQPSQEEVQFVLGARQQGEQAFPPDRRGSYTEDLLDRFQPLSAQSRAPRPGQPGNLVEGVTTRMGIMRFVPHERNLRLSDSAAGVFYRQTRLHIQRRGG
jgi:hypothetical protein